MPNTHANTQHDFKGLGDWVHIFSAGEQTDSKGRKHNFTQADLDSVIANHDAVHPAPHVITHKELYSPFAFGQSAELKRDGDHLYVKSKNINPDFEKLVEKGALYERSVRLVPMENGGWKLGHIAWLGAEPPAVEGLEPVQFSAEPEALDFAMSNDTYTPNVLVKMLRRFREWMIGEKSIEAADRVIPEYELESLADHVNYLREQNRKPSPEFSQQPEGDIEMPFTQEQLDAAVAQAKADAAAEFEQSQTTLQAQLDAERRKNRAAEFSRDVDALIDAGKLTPAQAQGMSDFMLQLSDADDAAFEFSAGEAQTVKKNPLQWFRDFAAALPKQVDLGERGAGEKSDVDMTDASALAKAAADYQAAERAKGVEISVTTAMSHVLKGAKA